MSWPFGTPLPSPLGGCCVLCFCVWCWCVPPLLWCAFVWVFLCLSHLPSFSQRLGGGWLKVGPGGLLGLFLFFPSLFLGVTLGLREMPTLLSAIYLFHSGHLDIFYFVPSQPCEFISHLL